MYRIETNLTDSPANGRIALAHGGGGQLTDELLAMSILPRLGNGTLSQLLDASEMRVGEYRLATTIDSFVVQPLIFPGGDIGRLAVCGTVNDLAVSGARPLGLALSLIIEEGFSRSLLEAILDSVAETARQAGVNVITGDTKVVGRGQGDGVFITTSGVGLIGSQTELHPDRVEPGDVLLINGPIADHGLAVMLAREMPEVTSALKSDVAPLNGLIDAMLSAVPKLKFMRDPTRGGLAGVATDLAARTGCNVLLDERSIPIRPETRHVAEMLGLDVLEVANEGKVVAVVSPGEVDALLKAMRAHPLGRSACRIGEVAEKGEGLCLIQTTLGGQRIIQKPYGEQLPRIC